jgi:hypothetical protein
MNPYTGLVALTANGIPPIKVSEQRTPARWAPSHGSWSARRAPGTRELRKVKTPASLSARLPPRVPQPPPKSNVVARVTSSLGPLGKAGRPPQYARRFGWSSDEQRQWMMRQRQKLWQGEGRVGPGTERPRVGLVQCEDSTSSVGLPVPDVESLDTRVRWCRKAGKWVQDAPSGHPALTEAASRNGIAPAVVSYAPLPGQHVYRLTTILLVALQAAASRVLSQASLTALLAGSEHAEAGEAEGLTVPSMNDGLDDGNGAWWETQDDRKGGIFPPVKPTLRDDVSALAIRKLITPRERARRREPLSLAGKHSQQFYGVEVLEHLDTVRKHLSSPLQSTIAHV